MRILQVRFKNLNSLWGEWKIDFTNPAYASDGIFAITGPTGAGKTTILDAICLALYGRTPRLKDLTQSTNEIMSRHAGECFAEVVFEVGTKNAIGRYCAHWSQHRAHKKPDGALQQPKHEIADVVGSRVLETRQRDVAAKIEEATGLTFDQFVRSMLLAQGSFSAFLQSDANERSPILEQITGTEIYSRISMRVHEVRTDERTALAALEAEMSGLNVLDDEKRKDFESKLAAELQNETALEEQTANFRHELEWQEGLTILQRELGILETQSQGLAKRQEVFDPERKRLERAQQALELGSTYAALVALRKEQEAEKKALFACQAKLPELETDVRRAEEAQLLSGTSLTDKQTEQKNLQDLLRKVRELDLKEREKETPIRDVQESLLQLEKTIEVYRAQYDVDQAALEKAHIRMRDVHKFLQSSAVDEKLVEQLAGIRTRFETLRSGLEKRRSLNEECAVAEKQKQQAHSEWNSQSVQYETVKAKHSSTENTIRKLKSTLEEALERRSISEWRESLLALGERKLRQGQVEEMFKRQVELSGVIQALKSRLTASRVAQKDLDLKIGRQQEEVRKLEKTVQLLENQMALIRRIQDLEEARHDLQDGEPCPLCGSIVHPYASGNIPQADEVQLSLRHAKEEFRKGNEIFSDLRVQAAQLDQEMRLAEDEEERRQSLLQTLEGQIAEALAELQLKLPTDLDPLTGMKRQQQKLEETLQKTRLNVERADKLERDLAAAKEEQENIRKEQEQLTRFLHEAEFKKESAVRDLKRLTQELRIHEEDLRNVQLDLTHQIAPFGLKNLPDDKPEALLVLLETRQRKWQEQHNLRLELEKKIAAWERDLHHSRDNLDKMNLELKDKNETCKKLKAERSALQQQRVSLFGDKNPDVEETSMVAAVEAAQKQIDEKRTARETVLQEFASMHARMEDLVKTIHIRTDMLQKADIAFGKQLMANEFRNEDFYLSACLPEAERKSLQERSGGLAKERAELDARLMDKKFALEELRRRHLTDKAPEEISERLAETEAFLKESRRALGALRQRLNDDETSSLKQQEHKLIFDRQQEECRRWETLHDLIGSADGQKYRNFAQGLTFEMVVRHANQQLRKMTDRYLLICDDAQTLGLKVVDNYQAGEVRSTKNLSGGESFIVSLALALGLSQMASQKIRVDSLFLDEGFGSLDEEALDVALSTLAGLRQEGKLIGIISHVGALKERIATQIEIVPQGNGRSIIRAPGCQSDLG